MRKNMKKALSIMLALGMVFNLTACGGGAATETKEAASTTQAAVATTAAANQPAAEQPAAESSTSDTLLVVAHYDPGTFRPGNGDGQAYNRIIRQIYEPLFFLNQEGVAEPWLAESYEWVDDVTFKVKLREGIKFSDGSDFTSEDVVWTITKAQEDALPVSVYGLIEEIEAPDAHTVVMTLAYPTGSMPARLASPMTCIASKAAYEANNGDYLGGAIVGTGPYTLAEYVPGDMITYAANEYYWREGEPKTPNMQYRIVGSDTTRATEAKAKTADIVINPNSREIAAMDAVDGISVISELCASTTYMLFNTTNPAVSDPLVREAFSRAINIPGTMKLVYGDFGSPASGMVGPAILGYDNEVFNTYFGAGSDIETAKQLLAEAGYPNGIDLEIAVESSSTANCNIAEAMQAQVQPAGINLKINAMDSSTMVEYLAQGKHQMCIYGWTSTTMEADGMLQQIQPGAAGLKRVNYDNQEFFDLYTKGCGTQDYAERGEIWSDCLEMLASDYVLVPLWHKALCAAVKDNVEGFYLTTDYEEHYFQWTVVNEE